MNKQKLRYFRDKLIRLKIIMSRMSAYVGIVNSGMLLMIVLTLLKDKGYITFDLGSYGAFIWLGGMSILFCFGYFEIYFLKGFQTEMSRNRDLDPRWLQLERNIDIIKKNTEGLK